MSRLLFVTSTRIGDAVLSSGLLAYLVSSMPGVRVTVACGPLAAPLFSGLPELEQLVVVNKRRYGGHWLDLWRQAACTRWDVVVDLRRSALAWLLPMAGKRLVPGGDTASMHRVRMAGSLVGLADNPPSPVLWTTLADEQEALRLIPDGLPVLGIGAAANWPAKIWRGERFAELVARLTGPDGLLPGFRVAFFGSLDERGQVEEIIRTVPADRCLDLVGHVSLPVTAACLRRCSFYVGNDSALMHMASAACVPTLGLFGPSDDRLYGPWGAWSAAVRTTETLETIYPHGFDHRKTGSLMDSLAVDRVFEAVQSLWRKTRS